MDSFYGGKYGPIYWFQLLADAFHDFKDNLFK